MYLNVDCDNRYHAENLLLGQRQLLALIRLLYLNTTQARSKVTLQNYTSPSTPPPPMRTLRSTREIQSYSRRHLLHGNSIHAISV